MHFKHDLELSLKAGRRWTLSPAAFDCSMNEDYVGILARQSRRISYKSGGVFEKTLVQHYLMRVRSVLKNYRLKARSCAARKRKLRRLSQVASSG